MGNDFEIIKKGSDVRIKVVGRTEVEALSSLIRGLAACQLSPGEIMVGDGGRKELKLGYSKKGYLPPDLINDILGLQAVSGQVYPEAAELSFGTGVLKAELVGCKKRPAIDLKEALYLNSVFKKENDRFLIEVDVIS